MLSPLLELSLLVWLLMLSPSGESLGSHLSTSTQVWPGAWPSWRASLSLVSSKLLMTLEEMPRITSASQQCRTRETEAPTHELMENSGDQENLC